MSSVRKDRNIKDRLITDIDDIENINIKNIKPINWGEINSILESKKEFALNFLKSNLT